MNILEKAERLQKKGEYVVCDCWECDATLTTLKTVNALFFCTKCERWFLNGGFLSDPEHCKKEYKKLI